MPIRDATPADIPPMMALAGASPTAAQWNEEHYRSQTVAHVALVLEEAGEMQGFILARTGDEWEIENVVVGETARRRGVGTQLLNAMLERAAKSRVSAVFLEVRASNAAARALYERCGFREMGRRPRYYHAPEEDAVLYSRRSP